MFLEKINKPNDIHKIALADFPQLADEIRQFLIESVSRDRWPSGIKPGSSRTYPCNS